MYRKLSKSHLTKNMKANVSMTQMMLNFESIINYQEIKENNSFMYGVIVRLSQLILKKNASSDKKKKKMGQLQLLKISRDKHNHFSHIPLRSRRVKQNDH